MVDCLPFSVFIKVMTLKTKKYIDLVCFFSSLSSRNQEEELSKSKDITSRDSWSNDPEVT